MQRVETVDIEGREYRVELQSRGPTLWAASGAYLDREIATMATSADAALNRWRMLAQDDRQAA